MHQLKLPVQNKNQPLHECVKEAVVEAINEGVFKPGERICSTKELSRQLSVSVVTAHRAMQELVTYGVLDRKQGLGTFVVDKLDQEKRKKRLSKIGLVFHRESMIGDYFHSQIVDGLRQAANLLNAELTMLHFDSEMMGSNDAFVFVNPTANELDYFCSRLDKGTNGVVVAAKGETLKLPAIDVDNVDMAYQAVEHLYQLGHRSIAYVGGTHRLSNNADRYAGFRKACEQFGIEVNDRFMLEANGARLDRNEKISLSTVFASSNRPTAVFAAGYYFVLDVYETAITLGLEIPKDLSVVGVDDPPSAMYLSPTLTTLRQPLVEVGHAALSSLIDMLRNDASVKPNQLLRAELVIRQSSGPPVG
ncbi:Arabinose metabolism transcriptional repressor [Poriferisphaera corsica]|uniref:Arabinose metabolism transcriptional repressor n=1 Tax=Poriferisphaera corsica TaxID=2528020 RepID=A0A517YUY3_9BACT|nr:GntR family transcriptional regulator [Poriferisphaera corsica]QDU34015.1 Arabinose metabolism transcriptional repressor [Poriferisphaera corsica]